MTNFTMDSQESPLQPITLPISGPRLLGRQILVGRSRHTRAPWPLQWKADNANGQQAVFSRAGSYTDAALQLRASSKVQGVGLRSCHH